MNQTDLIKLVHTPDTDLLSEFPDYTRDELRKLKREHKVKIGFMQYLLQGRTMAQLEKKFRGQTTNLLHAKYEGYELFTQEDLNGEIVHILLPKPLKELKLAPRKHLEHAGIDENGNLQPYLLVNLPKPVEKITIVPLFDVHYGHSEHKDEKFRDYLEWIKSNKDIYAVLGGDLAENALDDGRGMTYDQIITPQTQLDDLTHLLAPIAHKCLVAIPGNHEWRTYNKSGIDATKVLADRLRVPYFSGPVYLSIIYDTNDGPVKRKIFCQHGKSAAGTKGGKINAASKPREFLDFMHFLLSGHVHDPSVTSEVCMIEDPVNCRLSYEQQWTVITQSFIGWERSYAYRAAYRPSGMGGVSIELWRNGDYRAELR